MNEIIDAPDTDKLLAQSRAPDVVDAPTDAIVVKTRLPIRERISALLDFE